MSGARAGYNYRLLLIARDYDGRRPRSAASEAIEAKKQGCFGPKTARVPAPDRIVSGMPVLQALSVQNAKNSLREGLTVYSGLKRFRPARSAERSH
jgi:hypothetical protein